MAIVRTLPFAFTCSADGASSSFDFTIATLPIWIISPGVVGQLSQVIDLSSTKPTEVISVYTNTGNCPMITAASVTTLGTMLHIEFESAPPDDLTITIIGTFVF